MDIIKLDGILEKRFAILPPISQLNLKGATMERKNSKKALKKYASSVLKDSLVTGLPNIVQTDNIWRKVFKSTVFLFCLAGFLYQSTTFIGFVLTFPSVVDTKISNPESFIRPAYTFCNNNGIKRSKYCSKYKDRCEQPDDPEAFCEEYPFYCGENITGVLIPTKNFTDAENFLTYQELLDVGHDLKSFLKLSEKIFLDKDEEDSELSKSPYLMPKSRASDANGYFGCFTKYGRADSSKEPEMMFSASLDSITDIYPLDSFEFDLEEHETFLPDQRPQAFFSIHSPFDFVNPYGDGILLKPGKSYNIHLRKEQEHLLPNPYHSNCTNYTEEWVRNNRTGPRTKQMCQNLCILNYSLRVKNCAIEDFIYPHNLSFCNGHLLLVSEEENERLQEETYRCISLCRRDCLKVSFTYEVQERYSEHDLKYYNLEQNISRYVYVYVYASDSEVVEYFHRPQYQSVEVFSFIGGFMGCWLGISLVAVADFMESVSLIVTRAISMKRARNLSL